nr:unnamed protein product [Callosobruchus analis]
MLKINSMQSISVRYSLQYGILLARKSSMHWALFTTDPLTELC